jgi:hypothetical protein
MIKVRRELLLQNRSRVAFVAAFRQAYRISGAGMTYILAVLAALVGAAAGFAIGLVAGAVLAGALGISSFEGASGYFAAAIGLFGGLIGALAAIVFVLRRSGHRGCAAIAGRGALVLGAIALLAFGAVQIRLATLENFPGGQNPQLPSRSGCPRVRRNRSARRSISRCRLARSAAAGCSRMTGCAATANAWC